MTDFDCFTLAACIFPIGWFLGSVEIENQNEKTESSPMNDGAVRQLECEAGRLPAAASAD